MLICHLKKSFRNSLKIISIFICLCFVTSELRVYAEVLPVAQAKLLKENIFSIPKIPEKMGSIQESYSAGTEAPTVIFIQDAHDSLEAQEHIAGLVKYFVDEHDVQTVFEEGYEGYVPTDDYFNFIQDPVKKEKAAYFLMDKLRVGGAEYAHITRRKEFKLLGVDSRFLHAENLEAYKHSADSMDETEKQIVLIEKEIKKLAHKKLPKEFKEWMNIKEKLDRDEMDLAEYLKRVQRLFLRHETFEDFKNIYPNIALLLSAESHKNTQMIAEDEANLSFKDLFSEMYRLEKDYAATHLKHENEKKIFSYYKSIQLLKKLNKIEMTSEEFQVAREFLEEFDTEEIADFIVLEAKHSIVFKKDWEKNIKQAVRFYEVALDRDVSIENRLKQNFENLKQEKMAVLVFGGFHKENIREILKENHISYHIISPSITAESKKHQAYYRQLMGVGHHHFERPTVAATAARANTIFTLSFGGSELRSLDRALSEIDLSSDLWMQQLEDVLGKRGSISGVNRSELRRGFEEVEKFMREKNHAGFITSYSDKDGETEGVIEYVNPAFLSLFPLNPDGSAQTAQEWVGKKYKDKNSPADAAKFHADDIRAIAEGGIAVREGNAAAGEVFETVKIPYYDSESQFSGIIAMFKKVNVKADTEIQLGDISVSDLDIELQTSILDLHHRFPGLLREKFYKSLSSVSSLKPDFSKKDTLPELEKILETLRKEITSTLKLEEDWDALALETIDISIQRFNGLVPANAAYKADEESVVHRLNIVMQILMDRREAFYVQGEKPDENRVPKKVLGILDLIDKELLPRMREAKDPWAQAMPQAGDWMSFQTGYYIKDDDAYEKRLHSFLYFADRYPMSVVTRLAYNGPHLRYKHVGGDAADWSGLAPFYAKVFEIFEKALLSEDQALVRIAAALRNSFYVPFNQKFFNSIKHMNTVEIRDHYIETVLRRRIIEPILKNTGFSEDKIKELLRKAIDMTEVISTEYLEYFDQLLTFENIQQVIEYNRTADQPISITQVVTADPEAAGFYEEHGLRVHSDGFYEGRFENILHLYSRPHPLRAYAFSEGFPEKRSELREVETIEKEGSALIIGSSFPNDKSSLFPSIENEHSKISKQLRIAKANGLIGDYPAVVINFDPHHDAYDRSDLSGRWKTDVEREGLAKVITVLPSLLKEDIRGGIGRLKTDSLKGSFEKIDYRDVNPSMTELKEIVVDLPNGERYRLADYPGMIWLSLDYDFFSLNRSYGYHISDLEVVSHLEAIEQYFLTHNIPLAEITAYRSPDFLNFPGIPNRQQAWIDQVDSSFHDFRRRILASKGSGLDRSELRVNETAIEDFQKVADQWTADGNGKITLMADDGVSFDFVFKSEKALQGNPDRYYLSLFKNNEEVGYAHAHFFRDKVQMWISLLYGQKNYLAGQHVEAIYINPEIRSKYQGLGRALRAMMIYLARARQIDHFKLKQVKPEAEKFDLDMGFEEESSSSVPGQFDDVMMVLKDFKMDVSAKAMEARGVALPDMRIRLRKGDSRASQEQPVVAAVQGAMVMELIQKSKNPAVLFVDGSMLNGWNELRTEAFAVAHQSPDHLTFVIYKAEFLAMEVYKEFARLKNVKLMRGTVKDALHQLGRRKSIKRIHLVTKPDAEALALVDTFLWQDQYDIWGALIYALSDHNVSGIAKVKGVFRVVGDSFKALLNQYRNNLVVRMAA